jgi:hypothetical protein
MLRPRGNIYATHIVSAAEAAYTSFYGHFSRKYGDGEWTNALPDRQEPWDMYLRHVYCEIFRGGSPVHGVPVGFYFVPIPNSTSLLKYGFQGWTCRAQWEGERFVKYAFGIIIRDGALATDDVVLVTAEYERGIV